MAKVPEIRILEEFDEELRRTLKDLERKLQERLALIAGKELPDIGAQRKVARLVNFALDRLGVGFKLKGGIYRLRVTQKPSGKGIFQFQGTGADTRRGSTAIPEKHLLILAPRQDGA